MKKFLQNITLFVTTTLLSLAFVLGVAGRQLVLADAKSDACEGVSLVTGSTSKGCGDVKDTTESVNGLITTVVNILSIVVGVVAVIMVIIGGFRFILSGGDATASNSARNTIIYAIVGLVIVAVAQILVKYVLNRVPG